VIASSTYWRAWQEARTLALSPAAVASLLGRRPYWACSALTDTVGVVVKLRVRSRIRRDRGSRGFFPMLSVMDILPGQNP
jgi:hypothetical protein